LTSEGLVDAEPQRGFRAAPISVADLRDLTTVRIEIEGLCLKRAIAIGDMAWESRIVACHHVLSSIDKRAPGDAQRLNDGWIGAHAAFHTALVAACDSPWLLRLRDMLYAQSERYRSLSVPLAQGPRDVNAEHTTLMEAVLARDGARAHALIDAHLRATMEIVLAGKTAIDEVGAEPRLAARVAS
jgi:DNA-binding GntR family transcriptional regulator